MKVFSVQKWLTFYFSEMLDNVRIIEYTYICNSEKEVKNAEHTNSKKFH